MALQIFGDDKVYKGVHDNLSEMIYKKRSEERYSVVMAQELNEKQQKVYGKVKTILLKTTIPAGEKHLVTIEYEGPLMKKSLNGYQEKDKWNHLVSVHPNLLVNNFRISVDIKETMPIRKDSVVAIENRNNWPVFEYSKSEAKYGDTAETLHVVFSPKYKIKDGKNEGYDMSGQFYTSYSCSNNFDISEVGLDITRTATMKAYEQLVTGSNFIFNLVLMIPFIFLTELVRYFYYIPCTILNFGTDCSLSENIWWEDELNRELVRFLDVFDPDEKIMRHKDVPEKSKDPLRTLFPKTSEYIAGISNKSNHKMKESDKNTSDELNHNSNVPKKNNIWIDFSLISKSEKKTNYYYSPSSKSTVRRL